MTAAGSDAEPAVRLASEYLGLDVTEAQATVDAVVANKTPVVLKKGVRPRERVLELIKRLDALGGKYKDGAEVFLSANDVRI